jgi:CheY-like chemotaxis protein
VPRLLLIDDDPALLLALSEALRLRLPEVSVDACDSAAAALPRIEAIDYDVVVTDVRMPGMDGLALLAEIRARRPDTPTVLISGHGEQDLLLQALRGGAYDYIPKPIDRDQVVLSLRRAIRTRQLAREVEAQRRALERHAGWLERVVAERTRELREASRAKDEFLAILSHELRTPLTPILTWAQILRTPTDPTRVREAASVIERNVRLQMTQVEDLLALTRLTRESVTLDLRPQDLREIVRASLDTVADAAAAKEIRVEVDEPRAPVMVEADAGGLGRVFRSVLTNAVKFTRDGGRVSLGLAAEGAEAVVRVRDDGVGIDPRFLPHVFEMFCQQEQGARRQYDGTGVGLALARRLTELHRGSIEVTSAGPGHGSEVIVRLPRVAGAEPAGSDPARELEGLRILMVEDNLDTGEAALLLLEDLGARVRLARNGADALTALTAESLPDVILCDLRMPDLDGFEFIARLRADPRRAHVPVVAVSGLARAADYERTRAAGFDAHLSKPFDDRALVAAVRRVIGGGPSRKLA